MQFGYTFKGRCFIGCRRKQLLAIESDVPESYRVF